MKIVLIIFLCCFTPFALSGEDEQWYRDGNPIPKNEMPKHMGSENGFGAQLALITDESFFKRWAKPGGIPKVSTVDSIIKGKLVYAITFFSNPGVVTGSAKLSASYEVYNPDGSIYAQHYNLPVLPNEIKIIKNNVYLSVAKMGITFEPKDQLGTYRVVSIIKDEIKNVELKLEHEILVKD